MSQSIPEVTPERFLRLEHIAKLLGTNTKYLREQRCRGKFTLPLVRKDGMLGCFGTAYLEWMNRTDNMKLT